jgi:hypothetical protein
MGISYSLPRFSWESLHLEEQVLEAMARLLGKEHPDTLKAMDNLAQTLYAQGDLAGARTLEEQVLEEHGGRGG